MSRANIHEVEFAARYIISSYRRRRCALSSNVDISSLRSSFLRTHMRCVSLPPPSSPPPSSPPAPRTRSALPYFLVAGRPTGLLVLVSSVLTSDEDDAADEEAAAAAAGALLISIACTQCMREARASV